MSPRASTYVAVLLSTISACWLFAPGLIHHQVPAFRDGFHFYYPQAIWLERMRQAGQWFPTWNAHESFGTAVAAQPSAALFYPLRVLWWIPALSVEQRYATYLAAHLVIAVLGVFHCARQLGRDGPTATLAGLAYGLSTPVVFQHCNMIYLCSAAWIGWGLTAMTMWLRSRQPGWGPSVGLATSLALMILAGDPHTAVNLFLIFVAVAIFRIGTAYRDARRSHTRGHFVRQLLRTVAHVIVCVVLTSLLAIPQWQRTVTWMHQTNSRLETMDTLPGKEPRTPTCRMLEQLIDQTPPGTGAATFDFSLAPWSLLTLVWPTLGGHFLPQHSRWWSHFEAEPRMWIPAVYFGFLPLIAVLRGLPLRSGSRADKCLFAVAIAALLLALGNFTPLWILRNGFILLGWSSMADKLPADRVAGPYYWLVHSIPGYALFRYPAKWTPIAIAAVLVSCLQSVPRPTTVRTGSEKQPVASPTAPHKNRIHCPGVLLVAGSLFWFSLAAIFWFMPHQLPWIFRRPDPWFGYVDPQAAGLTIALAAAWPLGILILWRSSQQLNWGILKGASGSLLLTWLELTLIAGLWVCFVPVPVSPFGLPSRSADDAYLPRVWADISEADFAFDNPDPKSSHYTVRQTNYQTTFLLGKLGLLFQLDSTGALQSLPAARMARLSFRLMQMDTLEREQPDLDAVLRVLGVQYRLIREQSRDGLPHLTWHKIHAARPLCELKTETPTHASDAGHIEAWQWNNPAELQIDVHTSAEAILLVRIFNAGNCDAEAHLADGSVTSLPCPFGPFFLEIPVPVGVKQVRLHFR